jgi:hypothetical protein
MRTYSIYVIDIKYAWAAFGIQSIKGANPIVV